MRHVKGMRESALHVRNIRRDYAPDPARIQRARTPILSRYSYVVDVRGTDSATGTAVSQHITVRSDHNLSRAEIESEATKAVDVTDNNYGLSEHVFIDDMVLTEARRRG